MTPLNLPDRALFDLGRTVLALPDPALRRLFGEPPRNAAGLDQQAWAMGRLSDLAAPSETPTDQETRRLNEIRCAVLGSRPETPVSARDLEAGGVASRLYVPQAAASTGPLLVYFHGGGWVQGSVNSHDAGCRWLADRAGVRILSVGYRLAPEHAFPAAFDDALAAYLAVAEAPDDLGADRVAVGGDSAGGNLAAALCLHARDKGLPLPAFQFLLYPVTDAPDRHATYEAYAEGFYLTAERMRYLFERYAPDPAQRDDPRVAPLAAADLSGLPPGFVATCLADPLRDEGEAYALRLRAAGAEVELMREPFLHGYLNTTALRSGRAGATRAADALRRGLARAAEQG